MTRKSYKLNVPGDFYVENGECIACTLPANESPDLIGEDDDSEFGYHCYFKKQPEGEDELEEAISAMQVSCCEALRYKGKSELIIKRIIDAGQENQIDDRSENVSNVSSSSTDSLLAKLRNLVKRP